MQSRPFLLILIFLVNLLTLPPAKAVTYHLGSWFIEAGGGVDVVQPDEVNSDLKTLDSDASLLETLYTGRLKLEHGLISPALSHFIELGYHTGTGSGSGISQDFSYFSALPLAATYYVGQSAWVDFGISLAGGVGLSPKYSQTSSGTTISGKGNTTFLVDGRVQIRFWFGEVVGATLSGGYRYYKPTFTFDNGTSKAIDFSSWSGVLSLTFALSGSHAGRSFVEVLPPNDDQISDRKTKQLQNSRKPKQVQTKSNKKVQTPNKKRKLKKRKKARRSRGKK